MSPSKITELSLRFTREITKSAAEAYAERGSVEGRSFELAKASSPKSFHHNYTAIEAILSLMAV